jgi:hypothetical protein
MQFFTFFLFLASLLGLALADGAAIIEAMKEVVADTVTLNSTVASYNGELLVLIKILGHNTHLLKSIKEGTKVAEESEPLEPLEALGVAQETQALVGAVQSSLSTIVSKKPVFKKRLLQPAILLTLKTQQSVSADFSAAIIEKVPAELQEVAEQLVAPVDQAFEAAIAEYKKF